MLDRTDWYPAYVKPLREGEYEIQFEVKIGGFIFGAHFERAIYKHAIRAWDTHRRVVMWRGLSADPLDGL